MKKLEEMTMAELGLRFARVCENYHHFNMYHPKLMSKVEIIRKNYQKEYHRRLYEK